jgi:tetratricopeptide (TPR) repeat protein
MEEGKRNLLTDHLDETIQGRSLPEAEELIRQHAEAREEWELQNLAVEAIRHEGLAQQVAAVKEQYLAEKRKPPVFSLRRPLQVAVAIILVIGAAAIFKFYSVSAKRFFNDHYTAYELPVNRGTADQSGQALLLAYNQKKWKEVVRYYEQTLVRNNQLTFLAGIAEIEQGRYDEAIRKLELVLDNAGKTGDDQFKDDAEFYLAMALLANQQTAAAITLFENIKTNPDHLYAERVKDLSGADLKILEYRTGKQRK